ncbi:MAG TPA: efflux RND transporter periplasmic adaptor subunit [Gemmatimonadales bacterium]|nr:efflux RND transporter periplasmic adaptor subunit [Gemmatimonadales bacterium]
MIGRALPAAWLAAFLIALAACHGSGAPDASADSTAVPVVGATTAVAQREPFTRTIDAIGTVAARPGHIAQLAAPGPARVARVYVAPGEAVARGAPLVAFDQAPFEADARSADAALAAAERGSERAQRLTEAGILPRKDAEQAAAALAQARANAEAARRARSLSTLRAPIAGVVTRLDAVLGASVDRGQPMVEVADPAALDILLTLSPADAARVRRGAAVTLSAGQRASGEPLGQGRLLDVAATVDSASGGVVARVRVARPARPLRIGETVFGQIAIGTTASAVTVPPEAIVPDGEHYQVFVVDSAGIAHARQVTVGGRTASTVEITSGLEGGETVVTHGAYGVTDSALVVPPRGRHP